MTSALSRLVLSLLLLGLTACAAQVPTSRLDPWIGALPSTSSPAALPTERPLRVSLIFLEPNSVQSDPVLPEEVRKRVADQLREEIARGFPLVIERTIPSGEFKASSGVADLIAYGKERGIRYLMAVMISSEEQEYPVSLFLGWTTHRQPGFRLDNWSLAEAALIDVDQERVVLRAEGRAWATLDRPSAPGINQWYPVIYLRPQDPERRIWPPTYEGAPITLRMVSAMQAAKRLALNIQLAWNEKRHTELAGVER